MTRAADERTRARHDIRALRALVDALEDTLEAGIPALQNATAVAETAVRLATTVARADAYAMAERES